MEVERTNWRSPPEDQRVVHFINQFRYSVPVNQKLKGEMVWGVESGKGFEINDLIFRDRIRKKRRRFHEEATLITKGE